MGHPAQCVAGEDLLLPAPGLPGQDSVGDHPGHSQELFPRRRAHPPLYARGIPPHRWPGHDRRRHRCFRQPGHGEHEQRESPAEHAGQHELGALSLSQWPVGGLPSGRVLGQDGGTVQKDLSGEPAERRERRPDVHLQRPGCRGGGWSGDRIPGLLHQYGPGEQQGGDIRLRVPGHRQSPRCGSRRQPGPVDGEQRRRGPGAYRQSGFWRFHQQPGEG